jgi:TonB family protein
MARGLLVRGGDVLRLLITAGLIAALPGGANAQRHTASVAGTVRDSSGARVAGVEVSVGGVQVRTDETGAYRLADLAPGTTTIRARRLGFLPFSQLLLLGAGEDHRLDIRLGVAVEELAGVHVTAPREAFDSRLAGFNTRSKQQVGHFVTRERIDRANSTTLSDMLREIPGVRIGPVTNQGRAIRMRGAACPPLVFVDGFPAAAGEFDVDMIDLSSVEGIEVYSGMATVPPEFLGPRDLDRCGVIAVWSRPSRAKARPGARTAAAPTMADTAAVYMRDQVDVAARPDSGNVGPTYPDSLYHAQVRGQVVVEFIVDTLGSVELESIEVLVSSDPLFTAAVRDALARARFVPAQRGGKRARQVVQYPFVFSPPRAARP